MSSTMTLYISDNACVCIPHANLNFIVIVAPQNVQQVYYKAAQSYSQQYQLCVRTHFGLMVSLILPLVSSSSTLRITIFGLIFPTLTVLIHLLDRLQCLSNHCVLIIKVHDNITVIPLSVNLKSIIAMPFHGWEFHPSCLLVTSLNTVKNWCLIT